MTWKRYSLKLLMISSCSVFKHILTICVFVQDIIATLREVSPNAEHRFCLRSIHEYMKLQWKGRAFKDHLWRCATASTVVQFEKAMDALKTFCQVAHAWLSQIPPIHWSRSHFLCKSSNYVN